MDYKQILGKIYEGVLNSKEALEYSEQQYSEYLEQAIISIDKKWDENIENFADSKQKVNLVIIGEAPMWGDSEGYIYNEIKETDFFRLRHLSVTSYGSNEKQQLLYELMKKGIIFLDVSPFPFNPKNTSICYSNRNSKYESKRIGTKIYKEIIKNTFSNHFEPKLRKILDLNDDKLPIFVYRYKKLIRMHNTIQECCKNANIDYPERSLMTHISSESSRINQEVLDKFLSEL